jgi:hypothetical protein
MLAACRSSPEGEPCAGGCGAQDQDARPLCDLQAEREVRGVRAKEELEDAADCEEGEHEPGKRKGPRLKRCRSGQAIANTLAPSSTSYRPPEW